VGVWVKSANNPNDAAEFPASAGFVIVAAPSVTNVTLATNVGPPQAVGTTITWTATPTGGVAPYQYKWMVYRNTTGWVMGSWTSSNTYAWTPSVADATYRVGVWVKSANNPNDAAEFPASAGFVIVVSVQTLDDVSTLGTVISSGGSYPGQGPANAFDGLTNTYYSGYSSASTYIGRDLGTPRALARIDVTGTSSFSFSGPVQYSDDGTTFVNAELVVNVAPGDASTHSYTVPNVGAHRYWTIRDAQDDAYHQIDDLRFYAVQGSSTPPSTSATTICSYHFTDAAIGWRAHAWVPTDCSNGLPNTTWTGVAQGQNGAGTSGQVTCSPTVGSQYNHPSVAGATDAAVTCFFAPPAAQAQPEPSVTTCTFGFPDNLTGSRTHAWVPGDCSNGLPQAGAFGVGYGQNGGGTAGMVDCQVATGTHYNNPTIDGATVGTVTCTFLNPASPAAPQLTYCDHVFQETATGWRTYNWTPADCSNGLPMPGASSVGQATNGIGTPEQAYCSATIGGHSNKDAAFGRVQCLFENPPVTSLCVTGVSLASVDAPADGSSGSFVVTAPNTCFWSMTSDAPWITVPSRSGQGGATVQYSVNANTSGATRTEQVIVGGQTLTVTQASSTVSCSYSMTADSTSFPSGGGNGSLQITASSASCVWDISTAASWIHVSTVHGSGNATVGYAVDANGTTTTRSATISLTGGSSVTVSQAATPPSKPLQYFGFDPGSRGTGAIYEQFVDTTNATNPFVNLTMSAGPDQAGFAVEKGMKLVIGRYDLPGLDEDWTPFFNAWQPYYATNQILAVFVADDVNCTQYSHTSYDVGLAKADALIQRLHTAFPNVSTMLNVNGNLGGCPAFRFPTGLTYVSVETYGANGDPISNNSDWIEMVGEVKAKMNGSQRLFLMPAASEAYGGHSLPTIVQHGSDVYAYAQSDPLVIGIIPFTWYTIDANLPLGYDCQAVHVDCGNGVPANDYTIPLLDPAAVRDSSALRNLYIPMGLQIIQ
jgi:hypothetical protein